MPQKSQPKKPAKKADAPSKKITPLNETPYQGTKKSTDFDKMYDKFQIINNKLNKNKKKK